MKAFALCCAASIALNASAALAADAGVGKRLAQQQCAVCHIVVPNQRDEVAVAPPFEAISRKFGPDADVLVFNLVGPHAKMNFGLRLREADDVAEYIRTLVCDTQ